MKQIPLRNRKREVIDYALIDDDDFDQINKFKWSKKLCKKTGTHKDFFYAATDALYMHRIIMGLKRGDKKKVDHIDHNGLNNQRSNLRIVTHSENQQNRESGNRNGTSKYQGVTFYKKFGRWRARVFLNGKENNLGYFDSEDDAGRAASEFRKQNVPSSQEYERQMNNGNSI